MMRIVHGDAGVNAWDQAQAEALNRLRKADAFILCTWDISTQDGGMMASAKGGGEEVMRAMLATAASTICDAYDEADAA